MATDTAGTSARLLPFQAVHYIRKDITYADDGDTVVVGVLPAGAVIIKAASGVNISTAFDGNSSNVLDIGYSTDSGTNNLATQLALGTATFVPLDEATGGNYMGATTDRTISALVTSTASATAGVGQIIIAYIPAART